MSIIGSMLHTLAVGAALLSPQQSEYDRPNIEVWMNDDGRYEQGDRMKIYFETDRDAFVTILRVNTLGQVRVIFPAQPLDNNYVAGGERYEATPRRGNRIHDEPGHGYVFALVSEVPFAFENYASRGVWDYHLIAFEGEEDRDPYDTFAHFMNDVIPPDVEGAFNYQAASYSVDERGSHHYYTTYRYYSVPHYHNCHVYRAFLGLRSYYRYGYDCGRVGVHIVFGSYGHHHYHNHYYHYGYAYGYDPYYYYGYGSTYTYRYVSGNYRHNHGVRRIPSNRTYAGVNRHDGSGVGSVQPRRRSPAGGTARRTVGSGSTRPGATVDSRRRTTGSTGVARPGDAGGRRTVQSSAQPPARPTDVGRRTVVGNPEAQGDARIADRRPVTQTRRRVLPSRPPQRSTTGQLSRRRTAGVVLPRAPRPSSATRRTTSGTRSLPQRSTTTRRPTSSSRGVVRRSPSASQSPPRRSTSRPRSSASSRPRSSASSRPRSSGRSRPSRPSRSSSRRPRS